MTNPIISTLLETSVALPELSSHRFGALVDLTGCELGEMVQAYAREHEANVRAELARSARAVPDDYQRIGLLEWAVERWRSSVQNRPLVNIHRRTMDDCWRSVMRYAGGDPDALVGPSHDELLAAAPLPAVTPQVADEGREQKTHPTSPLWDSRGNPIHANIDALREQQRLAATPPVQTTPDGWCIKCGCGNDSYGYAHGETCAASVPAQTGEVARLAKEARSAAHDLATAHTSTVLGLLLNRIDDLSALAQSPTIASPEHRALSAQESAAVDEKAGLKELPPIRMSLDEVAALEAAAADSGVIVQAHVRELLRSALAASHALVAEVGGRLVEAALATTNAWSRLINSLPQDDRFEAFEWGEIRELRAALAANPVVIAGEKL